MVNIIFVNKQLFHNGLYENTVLSFKCIFIVLQAVWWLVVFFKIHIEFIHGYKDFTSVIGKRQWAVYDDFRSLATVHQTKSDILFSNIWGQAGALRTSQSVRASYRKN